MNASNAMMAEAINAIESRHGCRILFAVESGSRAWGFASPDSDYDVRGVYVKPLVWYLQLRTDAPDTIVENLPGDIDVSLWDLRKALVQMGKSNASFLEWLGSPIVYKDDGTIAALNALMPGCFNPVHVAHHYASMLRKAMEARNGDGSIRIKKLCYALRASLCMRYALTAGEMPPTPFSEVLGKTSLAPGELTAIRKVLARKEIALESEVVVPDASLANLLADGSGSIASNPCRNRPLADSAYRRLEQFFRDTVTRFRR